jgi:integrase
MPKLKLSERAISRMPAPDPSGKQMLHWDTDITGLAVLCSGVSNSKTFVVQRALKTGKTRRLTIGATNTVSLEDAREQAADTINDLRRGVDPKRKMGNPTLRESLEGYLAARKNLRPASVRTYRQIERTLEPWLDLPLREITGEMIEDRHRALAAATSRDVGNRHYDGTSTANYALRTFRILWNFASERTADLPPNPVRRLKRQWYSEPRRTRMVRAEEMLRFYTGVQALRNAVQRDYITLLLFTGLRRSEAATLKWDDVDLKERVIRVPAVRTKAGRKLDLPMSDVVRDLLVARRALGNTGFVFPGAGASGRLSDTGLAAVATATGVKVSAHDLRRTFVTVAESADISPIALKALVNHALGGDVTSGYVIMSTERLREPAQKVCDKLKALCGIEAITAANVARL